MSKFIEITISPTGETTIQTKGYQGESCRDASRKLETALGLKTREQLTSEFHVRTELSQTTSQR